MRPTIGVTSPVCHPAAGDQIGSEVQRHFRLLESLGADVVVIAKGEAAAQALERPGPSGILFSGGGDVAASLYGGSEDLSWDRVDTERDAGEVALFHRAFAKKIPMLCVCRGMQLANVVLGGTLIEDLQSELGTQYRVSHHQMRELERPPRERIHEVSIEPDSGLAEVLGASSVWTNSLHHQAIRTLAPPLRAVGRAEDGVIEAIELRVPDFFFFGVQWHPEHLPADDSSVRLYTALLEAATATIPESRMRDD
ncbi:MAG: gamma-glutamyl-gamma-aminobutyrate hydrolase family protein [Candidatus Tyrphobacter sp.]